MIIEGSHSPSAHNWYDHQYKNINNIDRTTKVGQNKMNMKNKEESPKLTERLVSVQNDKNNQNINVIDSDREFYIQKCMRDEKISREDAEAFVDSFY